MRVSGSNQRAFALATLLSLFSHASAAPASLTTTAAQFNTYVDPSFTCPVLITCPQICVAANTSCPTHCDADLDQVLCADGTCQTSCPASATALNPCTLPCAPKACPSIVQYSWACDQQYGAIYDAEQVCQEQQEALFREPKYNELPFLILAAWFVLVTICVWIWNTIRRRNSQTEGITQTLQETAASSDSTLPEQTVTGYRTSLVGSILYGAVMAMLVAFQILIFGFAISSYGTSQTESLVAFEITWSLAFVYTLLFKYPYSIASVFYKECSLQTATMVCVVTPIVPVAHSHRDPKYIRRLRALSTRVAAMFHCLLACFFSVPGRGRGRLDYVAVKKDIKGTRYFVFEFRRYNFNVESQAFEPGDIQVVDTIADVLGAANGLSSLEVERRLRIVGPNSIDMLPPSFWRSLGEEFHKSFYVYQLFMLWSWVPLYYFYLATIHGSVIICGGLAVAWFKYRNESNLFKLTHIEGEVDCLRDGSVQVIPQADLVPGDVVQVAPGKTYSDMILVTSEGLLVDESALTGESTPMAKKAVDAGDSDKKYNPLLHKKHTISAGTTVVESEVKNNLAVVLKTGSYTSKGELLREVFSYERHQFKFDVEVGYVLFILFIEAIIGFVVVTQLLDDQPVYSWFYGMQVQDDWANAIRSAYSATYTRFVLLPQVHYCCHYSTAASDCFHSLGRHIRQSLVEEANRMQQLTGHSRCRQSHAGFI